MRVLPFSCEMGLHLSMNGLAEEEVLFKSLGKERGTFPRRVLKGESAPSKPEFWNGAKSGSRNLRTSNEKMN